jgi:hypothetical protein
VHLSEANYIVLLGWSHHHCNMSQQEAAKAVANLLSKVTRYSVLLGIGGSALQASLFTGNIATFPMKLSFR